MMVFDLGLMMQYHGRNVNVHDDYDCVPYAYEVEWMMMMMMMMMMSDI